MLQLKDSIDNDEPVLDDNGDDIKIEEIEEYEARDIFNIKSKKIGSLISNVPF